MQASLLFQSLQLLGDLCFISTSSRLRSNLGRNRKTISLKGDIKMIQSQLTLKEFEALPQPSSCRLIDFDKDKTEVRPGIVKGTYILIVRGIKPYVNMEVNLVPLVYVRQPEYWGIEVTRCLPGGIGLPATEPYTAVLLLNGTIGTKGIEVIGATCSEKILVPPKC